MLTTDRFATEMAVMDAIEPLQRLLFAIAIGVNVGTERHWRERDEEDGKRTAGIRTFGLVGMLGGITGSIAAMPGFGPVGAAIVIAAMFTAFAAVFALYQYREAVADDKFSATTTVAAMLTFALGTLSAMGDLTLASAAGVALVAILASRDVLHNFVERLSWAELRSAIVLLGMTFIILPLLPEDPIGPFGGISPSRTWLLVIILAAISFGGYVAVRLLGPARGELVAGAIGGVISSTATTLTNARRSTEIEGSSTLAAGALAASAVSYVRTAILVGVLAAPLGPALFLPLGAGAIVMAGFAGIFARRHDGPGEHSQPKNPFDIVSVLKMAAMLTAVAFLSRAAASLLGDSGLILVSALSGLADVDAVVVAVTGMAADLSHMIAVAAIGVAVISNTVSKAAYAIIFGSRSFGLRVLSASAAALAAAAAAYWLGTSLGL
ncbi:MAG: MgtC/SapB family protein [Sphingobium sp.]